jgi:hypothetical protein
MHPVEETCRENERVVDPKYLDEIRAQAKEFSTKKLAQWSTPNGADAEHTA